MHLSQTSLRGKSLEHVGAVCIFISSKKMDSPIIHKRFIGIKGIRERIFNKCVLIITNEEN